MSQHVLYRFFDAEGQLLYVGRTISPRTRLKSHVHHAWWSDEIHNVVIERLASHDELVLAEMKAIRAEEPRYNAIRYGRPLMHFAHPHEGIGYALDGLWSLNAVSYETRVPRSTLRHAIGVGKVGARMEWTKLAIREGSIAAERWRGQRAGVYLWLNFPPMMSKDMNECFKDH